MLHAEKQQLVIVFRYKFIKKRLKRLDIGLLLGYNLIQTDPK